MKYGRLAVMLILLVSSLLLTACSQGIAGTWTGTQKGGSGEVVARFDKDGTWGLDDGGQTYTGTYEKLSDNTYATSAVGRLSGGKITLDGGELDWVYGSGYANGAVLKRK